MKIFTLLRKIQRMELPVFQKYLQYVYEKTDNALPLFDYFKQFYPAFDLAEEPDEIHRIVFGEKQPYDKKISNLCSDLHLKVRDFWLSREIKSNPFEIKYLWLRVLQKRGLKNEFYKASKQLYTEAPAKKEDSAAYLHSSIAHHVYYYESAPTDTALDVTDIQEYADNLDRCYALFRLKAACEMASLNRTKKGQYDLHKMVQVQALIAQDQLAAHPLLHLYVSLYQMIQTPSDDAIYETTEALYRQYTPFIDPAELIKALTYLINYGALQVREKALFFWQKSYEIVKFTFDAGVFAHTGAMSGGLFNNIIHIVCKAEQFDWARKFMEQQIPYLESDVQVDTKRIAEATLRFEQRQYAATVAYLSQINFQEVIHTMRANIMLLISCYETRSENLKPDVDIDKICDNFKQYLYRHRKTTTSSAQVFLPFIRILQLLLRRTDSPETILQELEEAGPVVQHEWLLQKVQEYTPRYPA